MPEHNKLTSGNIGNQRLNFGLTINLLKSSYFAYQIY